MPPPARSIRSKRFVARLSTEGKDVRDRFEGTDQAIYPGMEALVRSDPELWGMPIGFYIKTFMARPSFLPEAGERLLKFLRRYDTPGINVRVSTDANLSNKLIMTIYSYEPEPHLVIWLTIGSVTVL